MTSQGKLRVLSAIQPTGGVHLGNYLGALRQWKAAQGQADSLYCVADLHAITVQQDPRLLRQGTLEVAQTLLAVGIDPTVSTLFVQSHVADLHTQLGWFIECATTVGELSRMTQFKAKGRNQPSAGTGLLTYPALMAADILLYRANSVPVGEDQQQHVELTRDVAQRLNQRYGTSFTIPNPVTPSTGARVRDLQDPTKKMSKSKPPAGTIYLFESLDDIAKKIKRAQTDGLNSVNFAPDTQPGVSNLLSILAAITDEDPRQLAGQYFSYGGLKDAVVAAVSSELLPIQRTQRELAADPAELARVFRSGAERAREIGETVLAGVQDRLGFIGADFAAPKERAPQPDRSAIGR